MFFENCFNGLFGVRKNRSSQEFSKARIFVNAAIVRWFIQSSLTDMSFDARGIDGDETPAVIGPKNGYRRKLYRRSARKAGRED